MQTYPAAPPATEAVERRRPGPDTPMIIEFAGVSGSGKTTVATAVLGANRGILPGRRSLGGTAAQRALCAGASALGILALPRTALRLSKHSSRELRELWLAARIRKRLGILFLAARYRVHGRSRRRWLHDQGLIQALAYMTRDWQQDGRNHLIAELYDGLGGWASVPDLIVEFSVNPSSAGSRTKLSGARHLDLPEIVSTVASLTGHVALLHRRFGVRVVPLDNDGRLAVAIATATAAITASER